MSASDPAGSSETLEELRAENERLREQLRSRSQVAARALATYQQRMLQMEEHAAKLTAANDEIKLVNSKLAHALKVLEDKDRRLTEDLHQARSFQQRILPTLPESERLAFAAFYRPAELVGGDIYDIGEVAPGRYRIFAADATGHGVQAALRTMILKSEYDRLKTSAGGPAAILEELNGRITSVYPGLSLHCSACCFELALDAERVHVTYATAAHPPLWHASGGQMSEIYQAGPFLGVVRDFALSAVELELRPGDRLYTYTDGLVEEWGEGGDASGADVVQQLLARRDLSLDEAVAQVVARLDELLGGRELADDAMLIGIELR